MRPGQRQIVMSGFRVLGLMTILVDMCDRRRKPRHSNVHLQTNDKENPGKPHKGNSDVFVGVRCTIKFPIQIIFAIMWLLVNLFFSTTCRPENK